MRGTTRKEKMMVVGSLALCMGLALAPQWTRSASVRNLMPLSPADEQLIAAVRADDLQKVKQALAQGAFINCQTRERFRSCTDPRPARTIHTPLMLALFDPVKQRIARNGAPKDYRVFHFLLNKGANPNIGNGNSRVPLFMALSDVNLTRLLLDTGANIHVRDSDNSTPLEIAAQFYKPDVVRLLLARGAQVNEGGEFGFTPLDRALSYDKWENAQILLAAGGKSGLETKSMEARFIPRFSAEYKQKLSEFAAWKKRPTPQIN